MCTNSDNAEVAYTVLHITKPKHVGRDYILSLECTDYGICFIRALDLKQKKSYY